jgi:hypothetical protein
MLLPLVTAAFIAQSLSISAAVAPRLEQFRYRFDNPSSFNTEELVPHFFEQRYDVIPVWFAADARYRIGRTAAATSVRLSLRGRTHGSDIDTFRQPSGDIATSGTDGEVMLRSWEVSQRLAIADARGWSLGLTVGYRRDRADFLPDDRIVTHTVPASITRTFITDRETTVGQTLSIGMDAERRRAITDHWTLTIGAGAQPVVRGFLLVQLPDKYPGVDLWFTSLGGGATAYATLARRIGRWHAGVTVSGAGAWGYQRSSAYALRSVGVAFAAGPDWR